MSDALSLPCFAYVLKARLLPAARRPPATFQVAATGSPSGSEREEIPVLNGKLSAISPDESAAAAKRQALGERRPFAHRRLNSRLVSARENGCFSWRGSVVEANQVQDRLMTRPSCQQIQTVMSNCQPTLARLTEKL